MQFNNNNYYVWEFSDIDLDNQAPAKIENSKKSLPSRCTASRTDDKLNRYLEII